MRSTGGTVIGYRLGESARRLGHARWLEMELFSLLGAWVADTPEVPVKLAFATASRHHGWHAELLEQRLPALRDLHPDRQTLPPGAEIAAIPGVLRSIDGADRTTVRLVAVYRVLVPQLIEAYTFHLDHCSPVADANVARTLGLALADLRADLATADALLADHDEQVADAIRSQLTNSVSVVGGILGPNTSVEPVDVSVRSSSSALDVDVPG